MTDYNGLKATELKELLKERDIPSTGLTRKQQYIDALEAQDAQEPAEEDKVDEDDRSQTLDANTAESEVPANDAPANAESNGDHDIPDAPEQSSDQSDGLKRKRDSPTPAEDEESTQKKLKSADDDVTAKGVEQDAPVPIESSADETVKPMPISDDVMDVTGQEEGNDTEIDNNADNAADGQQQASADSMAIDSEPTTTGPASTHPPTSALYIRNLLRPLQLPPFREHLTNLATPSDQAPDTSLISEIHLDTFKSHAFVLFTSPAAAALARASLHDRIWPQETQRKPLWVDFVPPSQAQAWIATELEAGKSKRFEVVYATDPSTGQVAASLEEAAQQTANPISGPGPAPAAPSSLPGPGMPNAPTGPRGDRPQAPSNHPQSHSHSQSSAPAPRKPLHSSASLSHFASTHSRPKIFYQPAAPSLVEKRLEELDRETSRDWDGGRQKPFGSALDQLRRYTFEDGDVVVDGGVDFGGFGRERGAGGGGGGGGGHGGMGGRRRGGGGGPRRR